MIQQSRVLPCIITHGCFMSKKQIIDTQGVSKAPSDEGAVTGHACPVTEGEITEHYNDTPITDSSLGLCSIFTSLSQSLLLTIPLRYLSPRILTLVPIYQPACVPPRQRGLNRFFYCLKPCVILYYNTRLFSLQQKNHPTDPQTARPGSVRCSALNFCRSRRYSPGSTPRRRGYHDKRSRSTRRALWYAEAPPKRRTRPS